MVVRLFFDDRTPFEVYNIIPFKPDLEQEFPSVAKGNISHLKSSLKIIFLRFIRLYGIYYAEFGHNVELVEYEEFISRLNQLGESSPIYPFMDHYNNDKLFHLLTTCPGIPSITEWYNLNENFFHSEKMKKYCPDLVKKMMPPLNNVKKDLQYLKDQGIFEKFGL